MIKPSFQPKSLVWLIFVLALILRVATIFFIRDYYDPLHYEYGIIAKNLAAGKGFVGTSWLGPIEQERLEIQIPEKHRNGNKGLWFLGPSNVPTAGATPLYPLLLAAFVILFGRWEYLAVQLLQALLSATLCVIAYHIARRFFVEKIAIVSAILIALYPNLIYVSVGIHPGALHTFMLAVTLLFLLRAKASPTVGNGIVFGLLIGLTALVEPMILGFVPFMVLWLWFNPARSRLVTAKLLATAGLACVLTVMPWIVRNYLVFHRLVPMRSVLGLNLWAGNNPEATGTPWTSAGELMVETLSKDMQAQLATLDEPTRYDTLKRVAFDWIKANPGQFALLSVKRLVYLWWYPPIYDNPGTKFATEGRLIHLARKTFYTVPGIMLLLILPLVFRCWRERSLFVYLLIAFTLPFMFTLVGALRYRLPVEPYLLIFFSYYVSKFLDGLPFKSRAEPEKMRKPTEMAALR